MPYTVTLNDFPDIPADMRQQAERRYSRTLEKVLGGADNILPTYRAWMAAEDTAESELSDEEKRLALQWQKAAMRAQTEGFNGLGEGPEAYFEVRVER